MKKKIIALCLVIALAATAIIGGTLAYFTDTDEATNTITVGKVDIDLTEASVAVPNQGIVAGTPKDDGTGFVYDAIVPGVTYAKDVDLTVVTGSKDAYVFVELEFTNAHALWGAIQKAFPNYNSTGDMVNLLLVNADPVLQNQYIVAYKMSEANGGTYSVVYKLGVKSAGTSVALFDGIKLPASMSSEDLSGLTGSVDFSVRAYAIQADGVSETQAINELFLSNGFGPISDLT